MSEMKDSGVKWIGNIPSEWGVKKGKYSFSFINGFAFDSEDMNMEGEFPVVRIGDIQEGIVSFENCLYIINNKGLEQYKIKKGDLLLAMSGATVGKVGIMNSDITAYINQRVGIIRSNNIKYIYYALSTKSFSEYIDLESVGSAQPNISSEGVKNFLIPCPNYEEQKYIADFLDKSTKKIDEILKDLNNEIGLLKEYKKSLITETVTKGLNHDVKMKDSGNEYIGKIPQYWKIKRTLNMLKMPITDGPHTTPELYDEGIPFVSAEAVSCGNGKIDFAHIRGYISEEFYKECCKKYIPKKNDIYMIKSGATTGRVAIVDTENIFTIWSPLAVFRCNTQEMIHKFMFYSLQATYFQIQVENNWSYGTQQNIGMRTLEHLKVCQPPIEEQEEIVNYLDKKCEEIDTLIKDKQEQVEKMEQYKKSLIYEYVTGKKRVKGAEELYG